jgi:hypothetical protein
MMVVPVNLMVVVGGREEGLSCCDCFKSGVLLPGLIHHHQPAGPEKQDQ